MKFRVNRQQLSDSMAMVCSVSPARSPQPILQCVKVTALPDKLELLATDNETMACCAIDQVDVEKPGEVLVDAVKLASIAKELMDETLAIETDDTMCHIRGEGSHFELVSQSTEEFPCITSEKDETHITISSASLSKLIARISFATAKESTRYSINGALFLVDGDKLTLVSTDGRRLARAVCSGVKSNYAGDGDYKRQWIFALAGLNVLEKLIHGEDRPVTISLRDTQVAVMVDNNMIVLPTMNGNFPKYEAIIPPPTGNPIDLVVADTIYAVKQAILITTKESRGVKVMLTNNKLTLCSRDDTVGTAVIDVNVAHSVEDMEIGFDPHFILDMLRAFDEDTISLDLIHKDKPGTFRFGDDFTYMVMPINLAQ